MSKVNRNMLVKIPYKKGVVVGRSNKKGGNRVYFDVQREYDPQKKYAVPKHRVTIGYFDKKTGLMHPNNRFKKYFPREWEEAIAQHPEVKGVDDDNSLIPFHLKIGLYAIVFLICAKMNILGLLDSIFGSVQAAAILDFAMYSIRYGKSTASSFHDLMEDSMLFSDKILDEDYYSALFKNLSREYIETFLSKWVKVCKEIFSLGKVWIVVDGSNLDSQCKEVEICEPGHNKSHSNKNIIAFSYAVTSYGLPLYYEVYRGGLVDAKALKRILDFLAQNDITVQGVILDRGYCTEACLNYFYDNKFTFKVIVKGNLESFKNLVKEVGTTIRLNAENLIKGTNIFGIQKKIKLFKSSEHEVYLSLFFSIDKLGKSFNKFIEKYNNELNRLLAGIKKGDKVSVSQDMKQYFTVEVNNGKQEVICNIEKLQQYIDSEGFFAVASNVEDSAEETYNIVQSKIYVEKAFMTFKSGLGYGALHVHSLERIYGKFFVAFVSCIIRYFLFSNAQKIKLDTSKLLRRLNQLEVIRDTVFTYPHQEGQEICDLLSNLDSNTDIFEDAKDRANDIYYGHEVSSRYRKTRIHSKKPSVELDEDFNPKPSKRGVPVGTKRPDINKDGTPRKKPGPKPKQGASPSKTDNINLDSTANKEDDLATKKRGVPKGTKRGEFNKDGSRRQKPGPKPKKSVADSQSTTVVNSNGSQD